MGTNYYWHSSPPCAACGRDFEAMHIGKSSGGWCFSLRVYPAPEDGPRSLDEWRGQWSKGNGFIRDEYGEAVTVEAMETIITGRSWPARPQPASWWRENHAESGPSGLARHVIGNGVCVGHGEGTWDLLTGDFS